MKTTLLIIIVIGSVGITSVGLLVTIDYLQNFENADRTAMVEMGYELTGSLEIPNESRDSMLAKGYELHPGGWIHKDRIKADLIWIEHPNGSGEMILDGDAMKKQYEELISDSVNDERFKKNEN